MARSSPFCTPRTQDERVAVCSIEKANVALNKMLAESRLDELAAVVVDEVHMVADPNRCSQGGVTVGAGGLAGGAVGPALPWHAPGPGDQQRR